jgi:DNA-binding NtrC family response regulator
MKTVLVVDDEEYARKYLAQIIMRHGFSVMEASNGGQAVEICRAFRPAVVFLDLMLPDIDGDEVLRQIAGMGPLPDVYLMTGYEDVLPFSEINRLGAKGFFIKPLLLDKIRNVLENMKNM